MPFPGKPWVAPGRPFAGMFSGAPASQALDQATFGTFTRSSEGSYLTRAPTDGTSSFLSWASSNVIRMEDRGDGNGAMVLLEGSRLNSAVNSRNMTATGWSSGSQSVTASYGPGCDGTSSITTRQYFTAPGSGFSQYQNVGSLGTVWVSASAWVRATSGTQDVRLVNAWSNTSGTYKEARDASVTTTYRRLDASLYYSTAAAPNVVPYDARDYTGSGGTGAISAGDAEFDLVQVEAGAFASSAIRTSGATVTRSADILTGPVAAAPTYMVNGRWTFDVAPIFSSAEGINHATDQCLYSFAEDDSERVYFYVSAGSIYIRVVSGGVEKVKSSALTFSAHQKLTVIVDGSAGSISVSGATSGNGTVTGTSWTRTTGTTLYIGNRQGATQPAFVRLGRYINAA